MNTTRRGFFPALAAIFAGIPVMLGMKAKERPKRIWASNPHNGITSGPIVLMDTDDGYVIEMAPCGDTLDRTIRLIPVKDRLPAQLKDTWSSEPVLVYCLDVPRPLVGVYSYKNCMFHCIEKGFQLYYTVTHWSEMPTMPLSQDLVHPIPVKDGIVLDGNLRIQAAAELGLNPTEMTW